MNESVMNLVNAIKTGDALATEQAFADAIRDKISTKIEDLRQNYAATMFNQVTEQPAEEQTETE